jgi:hypothetical protein
VPGKPDLVLTDARITCDTHPVFISMDWPWLARVFFQDGISWDFGSLLAADDDKGRAFRAMTAFSQTLYIYWTHIVDTDSVLTKEFVCEYRALSTEM